MWCDTYDTIPSVQDNSIWCYWTSTSTSTSTPTPRLTTILGCDAPNRCTEVYICKRSAWRCEKWLAAVVFFCCCTVQVFTVPYHTWVRHKTPHSLDPLTHTSGPILFFRIIAETRGCRYAAVVPNDIWYYTKLSARYSRRHQPLSWLTLLLSCCGVVNQDLFKISPGVCGILFYLRYVRMMWMWSIGAVRACLHDFNVCTNGKGGDVILHFFFSKT